MPDYDQIEVRNPDGTLLRHATEEELVRDQHHYRLIRNRRGYLKRAIRRDRDDLSLGSLTRTGTSFAQHLPTGAVVWALRGIAGSER
jgi:hypothetical protein